MKTYIKIHNNVFNTYNMIVLFISAMALLLINSPTAFSAESADKEKILTAIEQRYSGKEFSASYEQTSLLKALDVSETASGRVFFSHPGMMRWEYTAPEVHQIISDGVNLWIYKPDEKQVSKGSAANFFKEGAGGAFLSDISTVRKNYNITINSADDSIIEMNMIPKKKNPDISSITITVLKDNYNIKRVVTFNSYGDATELLFSNITFTDIDDALFEFTIPNGVDIIYMD
ncbi:MAG: outer membrane lipoprotein chaperone LolA [Desulfamplus sp.]|nr:outer membrane lipoprotein chaperone LolA [Desulfamplus sp.]MBF0412383.1 outer membrane lipoprotein chaperone LolA [Desulfamplus sp.]